MSNQAWTASAVAAWAVSLRSVDAAMAGPSSGKARGTTKRVGLLMPGDDDVTLLGVVATRCHTRSVGLCLGDTAGPTYAATQQTDAQARNQTQDHDKRYVA